MQNWLFCETRNFVKRLVSFAKQQNSFHIEFRETSFAGNPNHTNTEPVWAKIKMFVMPSTDTVYIY
jgi:hypothetical protein